MRVRLAIAIGIGVFAAHAGAVVAQPGGNIDLQAFRPAMDSRGFITVNASQVLGHKELSFGLVTNWGKSVLRLESGDVNYEVENILSPTLVSAIGLRLGEAELELGISVPFTVVSGDRDPDSNGGTPDDPRDDANYQFEGQGLGDVGLHAKMRFLNTSRGAKIGLAVVASVFLPTASESGRWLGGNSLTPQAMLVVDRELGRFHLAANLGLRLRTGGAQTFRDEPMTVAGMAVPTTGETVRIGTSIPFGVGLSYALSRQKIDVVGELFGDAPLSGENYLPVEALVGLKVYLARNSFLMLGGGTGLMRGKAGSPDLRAFLGIVFEPSIGDRDGDGYKDDVDKCPDDPEDFDEFEDADGCPELDNDRDGIVDKDDRCPNEPEDRDGFEDEDGCPETNKLDRDNDGILDKDDACPDDPEDKDQFQDQDGCPDEDNDNDKILDIDDVCPDDPEDVDEFQDADGCPDHDNDGDRILDKDDQCPGKDGEDLLSTKENYNGVKDADGCPDRDVVVVGETGLTLFKKVYFEYDSAVIKPQSYAILNVVAKVMKLNSALLSVEIQGHTDERGRNFYNRRLSQARAESVRKFLAKAGVDQNRLTARGYGETVPLDKRHNQEAWAKNRRVEFVITKRAK